jgi:hypothetical protein
VARASPVSNRVDRSPAASSPAAASHRIASPDREKKKPAPSRCGFFYGRHRPSVKTVSIRRRIVSAPRSPAVLQMAGSALSLEYHFQASPS